MIAISEPGFIVAGLVLVLLFGSQLPRIARNLGLAGREFRKAQQEAAEENGTVDPASAAGGPVPPPPVAIPPAESAGSSGAAGSGGSGGSSGSVTMSKDDLDALIKEREEKARREATGQ